MSKSIKFKNDTYLNSSGVVFGKTPLDKILTYSKEEQIIGKWINDKKLYRKVIELPNGTGTTNEVKYTLTDYGIENVEEIYIASPSFYSLNENTYPFAYYDGNKFVALVSPTTLVVQLQYSTIANSRVVITLEYTKTTD